MPSGSLVLLCVYPLLTFKFFLCLGLSILVHYYIFIQQQQNRYEDYSPDDEVAEDEFLGGFFSTVCQCL